MAQALKRRADEVPVTETGFGPRKYKGNRSMDASLRCSLEDRPTGSCQEAVNDTMPPQEPVVREWQRRIEPELVLRELDSDHESWSGKRAICFMFTLSGAAWGLILLTAMLGL